MKRFSKIEIQFIKDNYGKLSYKEIAKKLNRKTNAIKQKARKIIDNLLPQGKSNFSRKQRDYICNDDFFKEKTEKACYWAGFLAADGRISKNICHNVFGLHLAEKDILHLEQFKTDIDFTGPIHERKERYKYKGINSYKEQCEIMISSKNNKDSLSKIFNVTPKKSLTLLPPNLTDLNEIDAFIVGYIDGDGTIGLSKGKRQNKIYLSILGTREILEWISLRFSLILGKRLKCIYKRNKSTNKNTYCLVITDKRARVIFQHYYSVNVPKLERKWSLEKKQHCFNFKKMKKISKNLDKGEVNIEDKEVLEELVA